MKLLARALFAFVLVPPLLPPPAAAQASTATPEGCAALVNADFSQVPDAPTHVTAARLVAAAADVPVYCQVQGYVAPRVGIELRLPIKDWNGKFVHQGCGGFCGILAHALACDGMTRRGYACIVTDMGHKSTALDAKWAYNDLAAEVDFGFRATHVATLAGKAVAAALYGTAPRRAYFVGCSTGGRQGMMEAQRFPQDYDGIVSGAPVINETGDGLVLLWSVKSLHDARGRPLLGSRELKRVNEAVIAQCDLNDGHRDGLIGDARACRFDPHTLICPAGSTGGDCLTTAQADAVAAVYRGPHDSSGRPWTVAHPLPGSELNWIDNYVRDGDAPSIYSSFMTDMFRFMNFNPDPGPAWTLAHFHWDRDPPRLALMEALYNAQNPDLRAFKARGGKLIAYQGWADQSVLPGWVVDYYETVEKTMGGRAATQEFFRLYTLPGVNHCVSGPGADQVDYLGYLDAWVERGEAPDRLVAAHPKPTSGLASFLLRQPLDPALIEFTRPLFPYPARAVYGGRGDPKDAASWKAVMPR